MEVTAVLCVFCRQEGEERDPEPKHVGNGDGALRVSL